MKTIKERISEYEYYANGFNRLCGKCVKVVNVRKHKDKYTADVILIDSERNNHERFNDCEYKKELFDFTSKKLDEIKA